MLSIVFIFLLNLAHDFCSLDHLNFYFSLFRGIVLELSTKMTEISVRVLFIHHVTQCSYLHSTVTLVSKHSGEKENKERTKKTSGIFMSHFLYSVQYPISLMYTVGVSVMVYMMFW